MLQYYTTPFLVILDTNTLHTKKRSCGFSKFKHQKQTHTNFMKPKTVIPPEEQKPGFSVHNRVPEADEESRERPAKTTKKITLNPFFY